MLGPIVALLLLTSPAAGPVDQLCMPWDSPSACQQQQTNSQLQRQIDAQQQQIDTMQQQERNRAANDSLGGLLSGPTISPSSNSTLYPGPAGGRTCSIGSISIC